MLEKFPCADGLSLTWVASICPMCRSMTSSMRVRSPASVRTMTLIGYSQGKISNFGVVIGA